MTFAAKEAALTWLTWLLTWHSASSFNYALQDPSVAS